MSNTKSKTEDIKRVERNSSNTNTKSSNTHNNARKSNNNNNNNRTRRESGNKVSNASSNASKALNDAAWYASSPQLMHDSASLSYNTAIGSEVNVLKNKTTFNATTSIPGVCAFRYIPGPGFTTGRGSPVNISAHNLYSYVRHANSGHSNYDAPDLMLYVLAVDSLYSFISYLKRIYGFALLYSQFNRYMPEALIKANGVNFGSILGNLPQFRAYINQLTAKAATFVVPNNMPIFIRHYWMNANLYMDEPLLKAQLYMFVPRGFYYFEEMENAGKLVFHKLLSENNTFESLMSYGNNMVAKLIASEDMNIMSGDILKAYDGNVFRMEYITEDFSVDPVYAPEVLNQIQNITVLPELYSDDGALDITQVVNISSGAAGSLIWKPMFKMAANGDLYDSDRILCSNLESPVPADNMVASRLMVSVSEGDEADEWWVDGCGSEIVDGADLWEMKYVPGSPASISHNVAPTYMYIYPTTADQMVARMHVFRWLTFTGSIQGFKQHPLFFAIEKEGIAGQLSQIGICADFNNFTVVDKYVLNNMHNTALLSMFNVPIMGLAAKREVSDKK